jgi:hypothetical protein
MNIARGSLPRLFVAALLTPIVPFILSVALVAGVSALRSQSIFGPYPFRTGTFLSALALVWLTISAAFAVYGLVLRALKRTRLRHHMYWALVLAAIPVLIALVELVDFLVSAGRPPEMTEDGAVVVENPYGCYEMFRHGGVSGPVTMALWASAAAATFKWMTYGFDRDTPATTGWKIAGAIYVFVLVVDFLGAFGQMSGAYSGWTDLLSNLCA